MFGSCASAALIEFVLLGRLALMPAMHRVRGVRLREMATRVAIAGLLVLGLIAPGRGQDGGCPRWRTAFAGMRVRTVSVATDGGSVELHVRVAETPEQQAGGFQCATRDEIRQHLILFDFGREIPTSFHMQNVPEALDIAFAKADGRIFAILRMESSPTALYGPMGPFRYALEARAGFFASRGITAGTARLLVSQ